MSKLKYLIAAIAAFAIPAVASAADSPIFGGGKIHTLDKVAMQAVKGQNTTSAYYAYLGNFYAGVAIQYGSYGAYLEAFGNTYQGTRTTYYYTAYAYSAAATNYYYAAYYYN
jgi:hypothetical protein